SVLGWGVWLQALGFRVLGSVHGLALLSATLLLTVLLFAVLGFMNVRGFDCAGLVAGLVALADHHAGGAHAALTHTYTHVFGLPIRFMSGFCPLQPRVTVGMNVFPFRARLP